MRLFYYRFYLGDKVDDFYLDRSDGFNIEKKMAKGVNIENHSEPVDQAVESVSGKNIRTFENTIQDYEQENHELDTLDNNAERMEHLDYSVEMSEEIHMNERDVIEVKEEMDIVEILQTEKTDKYCEDSSPMSITIHSEGQDPVQITLNRFRHKKRPQNC